MPMQFKAVLEGVTDKKTSDGRKIFKGVATSLALDRHREVVVPKGADLANFLENAVLMRQHEHREEPVGMLTSIETTNDAMKFEFVFDEADPEAARIMGKVERGFMKTFSIGFLPTKWVEQDELVDDTGKMLDEVEVDIGNGMKQTLDMTKYKATPRRIFTQWELLEVSLVSIPANPEARVRMLAKEIMDEAEAGMDDVTKTFLEADVVDKIAALTSTLKEFEAQLVDYHLNGYIKPHSTKTADVAWDHDAAQARLAKWASEDKSGSKESISWGKYARGFCEFDTTKASQFSSYKRLHHDIQEEELVGVKKAITSGMAALLEAHAGAEVGGEGTEAYNHFAGHYNDLGIEPPEFGRSYSADDLAKIREGTWSKPVVVASADPVEADPDPQPTQDDRIVKLIALLEKGVEMIETRAIGFNIKFETLMESVSEMSRLLAAKGIEPGTPPSDPPPVVEPDATGADKEHTLVAGLKDALAFYKGEAGDGK